MKNYIKIREESIKYLSLDKRKEWLCHVQFVEKIALDLVDIYGGDKHIVSIAAILHDIGRDREVNQEDHRETGVRIARDFLSNYNINQKDIDIILQCVKNHGAEEVPTTVEEKIIITADSASKILYHQAFMLMVKKQTYIERAEWGMKYLNKGYSKIQFDNYKDKLTESFLLQTSIYSTIISGN